MGRVRGRHLPDIEPSKLQPNGPKKKGPRYLVEMYWPPWVIGRISGGGCWRQCGAARVLHEAINLAKKPGREWMSYRHTVDVRVTDTQTGEVVFTQRHEPRKVVEGAKGGPNGAEPTLVPGKPIRNTKGSLCGLCDGTDAHEHPPLRCTKCGVEGLVENMDGRAMPRHQCKP